MPRLSKKNNRAPRSAGTTKYDAHHRVLSQTYGALADLRRELADPKSRVAEREELLGVFSTCADSQRAWLLLEDYFEKLSLSRRDFATSDWWPRLLNATGPARLEGLAILFLRNNRPLPSELTSYASAQRFAEITQAEHEQQILDEMEHWLFPPEPTHLDSPRAALRVLCDARPANGKSNLQALVVRLNLYRPRTGEKIRPLIEVVDITRRAAHEQELFSPEDWAFMQWLTETYPDPEANQRSLVLTGCELLGWLSRWGNSGRLEFQGKPLRFDGQILSLTPHLENGEMELSLTHRLVLPDGKRRAFEQATLFEGRPAAVLLDDTFYVFKQTPPSLVLEHWSQTPWLPVRLLGPRLQKKLREDIDGTDLNWENLSNRDPNSPEAVVPKGRQDPAELGWRKVARELENWMLARDRIASSEALATVAVVTTIQPLPEHPLLHEVHVQIRLKLPRAGNKARPFSKIAELVRREAANQKLFSPEDWRFLAWLSQAHKNSDWEDDTLRLSGLALLQWLAHWGQDSRLEIDDLPMRFLGQVAILTPHFEKVGEELTFAHRLSLMGDQTRSLTEAKFFAGQPAIVLVDHSLYLLRNAPPPALVEYWSETPSIPIQRLSHRLRTQLRKTQVGGDVDWDQLCVTHKARPRFVFELNKEKDTVELRLRAIAVEAGTEWQWTGKEWQPDEPLKRKGDKPEVLEDPRLDAAVQWLRLLDWFTPERGLWIGDASENFLNNLAMAWPSRPEEADYLGNPSFQRLFLAPRRLRPKLVVKGSGIDWLSVSAEWEEEGLKLTKEDLQRLAAATTRFVKLPDAGWVELDTRAVEQAQETMADLGVDGLNPDPVRLGLEQAAALSENSFERFVDNPEIQALRKKLEHFEGIPQIQLPDGVHAELRPYQKEGFHFLCHLTSLKLGGILADDMGLGKTLQTLTWLSWLQHRARRRPRPALVICPASVLYNWRREAERFTPHMKILVLESGAARHRLRKQIPQNDLIITNYALLRRDWEELEKFNFSVVILDEAQFIKNPGAQVTISVKKLRSTQRLALTGTPLENRLLDLWSITDFVQPGYLGSQEHFLQTYEPKAEGEDSVSLQRIARRRLSAKLRPLLKRRLKKQVAKDLPDRIEERRDCELGEDQRKLYLAELRRSREQVLKAVQEKGLAKSKMHVLAALTRLRQICCHPTLVGSDSASGKTETLFELLEPLLAEGQKVLLFSQFVQMLKILERECAIRQMSTHILTGETKERQTVVQNFQDDTNAAVFLLSLRAAGTGLNLTTASYVVLYDPWWNPAVEAQAIDRSHRIGQTQTVNAYRLITPGTVEEKIWDLQQRKAQTIADVLGEEGFARSLSQNDLEYLFSED